jgi:prophage tail gpP-like protein
VLLDGETVITGYVDVYAPGFDGRTHRVEVRGRSKTADLVDSAAVVEGGQLKGLTVPEVAKKLAKPFGIEVVTEAPAGEPLPDVQLQQGETAHAVVERLSRVQEVLVSDDARGRLVLARAGAKRAGGPLVQGQNILAGRAELDASQQFSEYVVKGQRPNLDDRADWPGESDDDAAGDTARARATDDGGDDDAGDPNVGGAGDTGVSTSGRARDTSVSRYRPLLLIAETQVTAAQAAQRAAWEARRRAGQAIKATVVVAGWRQVDGTLWDTNMLVPVTAPWLGLDRELLVASVEFQADDGGARTELGLTLPDAFLPDAAEAKRAAKSASGEDAETKEDFWRAALDTGAGQ